MGRLRSNSSRSVTRTGTHGEGDGLGEGEEEGEVEVVHAVDSKAQTAALPPVMSKSVDKHPLCWLGFEEGERAGRRDLIEGRVARSRVQTRVPAATSITALTVLGSIHDGMADERPKPCFE